ncbi:unnamed protein product, partial [Didymodactylos carnosus]
MTAAVQKLIFIRLLALNRNNVQSYLRRHYGPDLCVYFRDYVSLQLKRRKTELALIFLKTCMRRKLKPTFIRIKLPSHIQDSHEAINLKQILLKIEIKYKRRLLSRVHHLSKNVLSHIETSVSPAVLAKLQVIKCSVVNDKATLWRRKLVKKLLKLNLNSDNRIPIQNSISPIMNYSKRILSNDEQKALLNGLTHVYPPTSLNRMDLITNVEYFYTKLLGFKTEYRDYEHKDHDEIISYKLTPAQISGAMRLRQMTNRFIHNTQYELYRNRSAHNNYKEALNSLSADKSIIICKPDKGKGIVILDKSEYIEKMNAIVNDTATFKQITDDPTMNKEDKLVRFLLKLHERGFISDTEYKLARPVGSRFARLYGLPKVHKPNRPIRPILSSIKTFNYGLGLMLAKRLAHLRSSASM